LQRERLYLGTDLLKKTLTYRWLIFGLVALGYTLVHFHRLCPAVLAVDIMKDLQTTGALTGLFAAAYFYSGAIMQLPAGLLSDSWGPRKTVTLFLAVACIGSVILGFAPTVFWAIVGRTIVGIGVAMVFVPTLKILAEWYRAREFATMTGILMAMGGVGTLVAATPLVWLSASMGWRNAFILVGLFTLAIAVAVGLLVRNRPADFGWPTPVVSVQTKRSTIGLGEGIKLVLTCRHFWPVAIWFFFTLGIYFAFGALWGGPYLVQVYHMTKAESGHILSMMAIGLVIGSPLLSFLSDRVFKGRKPVLILASVVVLGITGLLAFYTDSIPKVGMYALFFVISVFSSAIVVIGFSMNKELFPIEITGTATGLVNVFPFAGGAVFQPVLGLILERYGKGDGALTVAGYQAGFQVLFLAALVALAAALLSKETMTNSPGQSK
jgi:sugar phosphate permease